MRVAVLASGPSLNKEDIELVRQARLSGKLDCVIAVSDVGISMADWADALASHDTAWWVAHRFAPEFKGRKFSASGCQGTEQFDVRKLGIPGGMNSGLFAMFIARNVFKAETIVLLGFDMHRRNGQHFFGDHTAIYNNRALKNSNEADFQRHLKQFEKFSGPKVYNCCMGSDLKLFPIEPLTDII